jgi:hypothetical protein
MVEQIGLDTRAEFVEIAPYLLQGEYLFDISPMVESLMRSERRAEATRCSRRSCRPRRSGWRSRRPAPRHR